MGSVWYWTRTTAGRRLGGLVALVLLIAVGAGGTMAAAAAARRTASAIDRTRAVSNMPDAYVLASDLPTFDQLTSVPAVEEAVGNIQLGLQPSTVACSDDGASYFPVLASASGDPFALNRPRILEGRLPSPSAPDEAVVSTGHAERLGVGVGDHIAFLPYLFDPVTHEPTGCGDEVVAEVEVVGVIQEIEEIGANGEPTLSHTYLTPAFLDEHPELADLAVPGIGGYVRVADDVDPDAFVTDLRAHLPVDEDGQPTAYVVRLGGPSPAEPAMKALTVGYWGLAAVIGLATAITLAAAVARQTAAGDAERRTLVQLGFDRRWVVAAASIVGAGAAAAGTVLAVVLAALLSEIHLVGVAQEVEPDPGFDVDPWVLGIGAAVTLAYAVALTAYNARRAAARVARPPMPALGRSPGLVDRLARAGAPPWAALGTDYALSGGQGRGRAVPARVAVTGVVAGTAGLVAVLIFGTGVGRATNEPEVYGWGDWDARIAVDDLDDVDVKVELLRQDPAVAAITGLSLRFDLAIDGVTIPGTSSLQFVGESGPTVVQGQRPEGADQIGLGVTTAHRLGVGVGDSVRITGPSGDHDVTVAGLLALPSIDSDSIGTGWSLDRQALDAVGYAPGCNSEDCYESVAIRFEPGTDVGAARARLEDAELEVELPAPGPEVILVSQVDQLPAVAAVGVGVVAGIGLAHTLAVTVRRRRRDLAVTRALGFAPRQAAAVLLTEGLVLGLLGAAIGALLGTVVGHLAWRAAATAIGIGSHLPSTTALTAAVMLGVVVVAGVAAIVPAVQAARMRPANGLRGSN